MTNLYYKPSGKFTLSGVALGLVGGLINGLILAFVYSYLISYIPFVYLNFLFTIGYGLLLGFTVGSVMRWAKVRNKWVGGIVALIVALISWYFSWAVWMSVLVKANINISALEIAGQPGNLWEAINRVNEIGPWSIATYRPSGGLLWIIWFVEALIILGGTVLAAMGALATTPFCEACKSWCRDTKELMLVGDADAGEMKRRMEAKDFDYLKTLGSKKEGQMDWFRVDIHECLGCGQTNALNVVQEHLTIDEKGKSGKRSEGVVDYLLLNKSDVSRLRQISQELGHDQMQS